MHGVFLDRATLDRGDLDFSGLIATLERWDFYDRTSAEQAAERIAPASVVVTNKVVLDAALLDRAAPHLRLIGVAATGTNNVDVAAAANRGITVTNVRGYATPAVVQHVFALTLALVTRLPDYTAAVRAGRWASADQFCLLDYPIRELAGQSLGIVGYGELGRAVAVVARALGMEVLISARPGVADTRPDRIALPALLSQADVLTLHCPLTAQTRGLIGAPELDLLGPEALLINTARGGIVDEAALAVALRQGRLGGAGVDVLTREPPRDGNPLLDDPIPNLIVTPHIAWASRAARQRLVDRLAANVSAFRAGSPENVVAPPD